MGEFYQKYDKFERTKMNTLIDAEVLSFGAYTSQEVGAGLIIFVALVLLSGFFGILLLVLSPSGYFVAIGMRKLRERYPRNYFFHRLWMAGMFDAERFFSRTVARPSKTWLGR